MADTTRKRGTPYEDSGSKSGMSTTAVTGSTGAAPQTAAAASSSLAVSASSVRVVAVDEESSTPYNAMMSSGDGIHHQQHQQQHHPVRGEESHTRSLVKGLTWRIVASLTTIVIAKIVTGETAAAFQIGFFEFFAKLGIYYAHERIWAKIRL